MSRRLVLLALLLAPLLARAESKTPLLAVLEFDSPDKSASIDDLQLLTDAFRSAVVKETGARFKVLTRDSMVELVPADQLRCFVGMCAAEIGRKLQAQYVMAGSVRKSGARQILTLEGYESNGGRVLGTEQLKAASSDALIDEIEKQARALVRAWLTLSGASAPPPPPPATASPSLEGEFWSSVKQSTKAADFEAYLQQFPSGTFRLLAENRLRELRSASSPVGVDTDRAPRPSASPPRATPPTRSSGGCPVGMVLLPGGSFDMGASDGEADSRPVHRVTLGAFCLDRTEHAEADRTPTVRVDWATAKAICEREGKRLPTEAEWEFAARGPEGRRYPWGDTEPTCDKANFRGCVGGSTEVGSLPAGATPEGVLDLAGGSWEWVADCFGPYTSAARQSPLVDEDACRFRVGRGGGWSFGPSYVRSTFRSRGVPKMRAGDLGFRCAVSAR